MDTELPSKMDLDMKNRRTFIMNFLLQSFFLRETILDNIQERTILNIACFYHFEGHYHLNQNSVF